MPRFAGKVAVVTGGASGVGAAVSRRLAQEGAEVIVVDLQQKLGASIVDEIGEAAVFHEMDITDEGAWDGLNAVVDQRFGRLDVLAHCAGVTGFGNIEDTPLANWRRTMDINAMGALLANRFAVQAMRRSGGGSIVNVGSASGLRAASHMVAYCASKAALLQITRCTALHCGENDYNIRCNTVLPGAIDTPLIDELAQRVGGRAQLLERSAKRHVLKRMGQPEEIAAAILYLASDDASFVTASTFVVDGGMCEI
jgi:3(or 17)beta-hydroxysteroid dehydrogenase